ncbi:spermidine synthase [Pleomorphomonas diazotrophica]|uniref:Spermidine synthase n=1 Tax=Pleomorphomonas diazotrophica TaxID=1166257 RepID=A0A1I4UNY4_9HYPH|nr:MnmC family methyltransferase [Pleomorphomonas diazotrophica]PKR88325.1 spermidine synthase [Pleomorphomonas diazotrophica]SFM90709.1 Spermine/spermidine synthase [Pleomorphomonas diazotrophica]
MLPWVRLGAVKTDDGVELKLMQRGSEFSIMLGANELMNSRLSGSEEALANLAAAELAGRPGIRMLIGGLGMGFTLRAALNALDATARITVAELMPAVIDWARGPMAEVFGTSLDDPRVALYRGDVGELIRAGAQRWDAILLDVDNGPEGLTRESNDALYSAEGLGAAFRALTPGGVFSVWSSTPNPAFTRRLRKAGFTVAEVPTRAGRKRGARHMIWVGVRG